MYAKIFEQIFDSSIADDWQVRHVFQDLLILADQNGVIDMTPEAIARRTNVPSEVVQRALVELERPDTRSRSKDHDGRRIMKLDLHRDWGWMIVNYAHYRRIASEQQRRERTAARVRKFRKLHRDLSKEPETDGEAEAIAECNRSVTACNAPVTHQYAPVLGSDACNAKQKQREKEKEKENRSTHTHTARAREEPQTKPDWQPPTWEAVKLTAAKAGMLEAKAREFYDYYESIAWEVGDNGRKMANWTSRLGWWSSKDRATIEKEKQRHGNYRPNTGQAKRNVGIVGDPDARRAAIQAAMRAQSGE